jgi:hypothetical protein
MKTLSQKAARASLGEPATFRGGVYVTTNGTATLHIMTAEERELERANIHRERAFEVRLKTLKERGTPC